MFRIRTEVERLRHENEVQAAALEAERQWRLTSLPALLAAEARAKQAALRIAELDALNDRLLTRIVELEAEVERLRQRQAWVNVTEPGGRP